MSSLKEMSIKEYISRIDFKSEDWSLTKIKEDMRRFLGEEPAIDIIYKKDVMINESGEAKEFKDIHKISIIFTDTDDKFKKIEFNVNEIL
jgi:kynurenine formamidase